VAKAKAFGFHGQGFWFPEFWFFNHIAGSLFKYLVLLKLANNPPKKTKQ